MLGTKLSIAVVGAGMAALRSPPRWPKAGVDVQVYEQAGRFTRIGAGAFVIYCVCLCAGAPAAFA